MDSILGQLIYDRQTKVHNYLETLSIKDRRTMFALFRKVYPENKNINLIFHTFGGVTLTEFCVYNVVQKSFKS
jgi:hypothetical protein